jgi:hypothetical protein
MKKYPFNLSKVIYSKVFPQYRVKTKAHIIEILMETTRFILLQNNPEFIVNDDTMGKMILYIDKMSRLFFFTDNKYYSIVFPFRLLEEEGKYQITFKGETEVTSEVISKVLSIIKSDEFKAQYILDFESLICNEATDCDEDFWELFKELLLMEDGYIRYDVDEEEYSKAMQKGEGNRHPLNHYDLFYSTNTTFKLGLNEELTQEGFLDLLNVNTDCEFI